MLGALRERKQPECRFPQASNCSMVPASNARAMPRSCKSGGTLNWPKKPTPPQLTAKLEPTNFSSSVAPNEAT